MNRKQKKELRRRQSTRQLMGIDQLTEHGLKTAKGELVFYLVSPDNLSVLSVEGVRGRVRALTELLRGMEAVELLALDSRESFQSNKHHYQDRLEQEDLPALRELLRQDSAHLDEIQSSTASAREFALVYRKDDKAGEDAGLLKQMEKRIRDCGFHVRMADGQDLKLAYAVRIGGKRNIRRANAVKYCDPGGNIQLTLTRRGKNACLSVSNPCANLDPARRYPPTSFFAEAPPRSSGLIADRSAYGASLPRLFSSH